MERSKVNNIDYCFIENIKYKTNTISIFFKEKITKENMIRRQILPRILSNKTRQYNSQLKLSRKLASLYSSSISASESISGEYSVLKFSITFIQSKYLNEDITKDVLNLLKEIVFNPFTVNEQFEEETINRIKNELKNLVKQKEVSFMIKAKEGAFKTLFEDQPCNYNIVTNEKIETINAKEVYDYYKNVISTNQMLLIFEGDKDVKDQIDMFSTELESNSEYNAYHPKSSPKGLVVKKDKTKQNNLFFVYDGFSEKDEDNVKNFFFSMMLGESPSSLLFQEVREKHSLAYSIGSQFDANFKLLYIYGGVKLDSLDKTIEIINDQLNRLKTEDFTGLLNDSRQNYLNHLYSSLDLKGFLTTRYARSWISNTYTTIEELIERINAVTIDDIKHIANEIQNKIMYVLQGEINNED